MGRQMARLLLARIDGTRVDEPGVILIPELVVRGSS
jgi:DNA-binding LacI/PurR family transcriptional regulator